MNIPNFVDTQIVDDKGFLTPTWKNILMQLFQQLQQNYSNEGLITPQQNAANVVLLNTAKSIGAVLYNTSTNKAMVNEGGTFKTIQTL